MKRAGTIFLSSLVVIPLSACGSSDSADGGNASDAGSSSESLTIAYSSPIASQPGQVVVAEGMEQAAEELGWDVSVYDANLDVSKQVSDVQTMLLENVGAIALYPLNSEALGGAFAQANEADVPVVAISADLGETVKTVWYDLNTCTDEAAGRRDAERLAEQHPGGRVIVMGGPPVPTLQADVQCFTEAATAAGLEVVDQADNTSDAAAGAATLAADLLTRHPDVDIFWAYNDSSALGISSAITAAGQTVESGSTPGIAVIGRNGDADAIEAVRDGRLTGTWDANQVAMGWALVIAAQEALDGDYGPLVVQSTFYDSENIADYIEPGEREYSRDDVPVTSFSPDE